MNDAADMDVAPGNAITNLAVVDGRLRRNSCDSAGGDAGRS